MDGIDHVASEILGQLERAWNTADGNAWADLFAEDADFVTVRGQYLRGRPTVAEGHQQIFNTIYKGSVNQYELLRTRPLGDAAIVTHAQARLSVPEGPRGRGAVTLMDGRSR